MDPEPAEAQKTSTPSEETLHSPKEGVSQGLDDEDPFSLSGTSISLFGFTMAIFVVGIPFVAVLTERPLGSENPAPTVLQSDGSKSSPPISLTRLGKSRS